MLQLKKISISKEIDINKTSASKECMLCQYWYFKKMLDLNSNRMFITMSKCIDDCVKK